MPEISQPTQVGYAWLAAFLHVVNFDKVLNDLYELFFQTNVSKNKGCAMLTQHHIFAAYSKFL